jgi:Na+/H+ antiporter NhaD/arsenite permease-like protein
LRLRREAIRDIAAFKAGWLVLVLLLAGFFLLEPLGVPVGAVAATGAALLLVTLAALAIRISLRCPTCRASQHPDRKCSGC